MREPKGTVSEIDFVAQAVGPLEDLPFQT
jgi:hypothetical protein